MSFLDDLEKLVLGKTLDEELEPIPDHDQIVNRYIQSLRSNYPPRLLGYSQTEGAIPLYEEDRESHIHILGSPGEGKSKFLELLLRQDIDNGYGACLLDPSDDGDTCYKVLKYAIKKGYTKIVLIDPHDISSFGAVPTINPIHYKAPAPAVVGGLMDAIRVLWGQSSFTDTPRIQKYLPAVLTEFTSAAY